MRISQVDEVSSFDVKRKTSYDRKSWRSETTYGKISDRIGRTWCKNSDNSFRRK